MDRPALTLLLDDIRHGLIDVIVVYKVDRLTRSLADFAKMVEIFDAQGVSFVAVTQQFNTTTSMGRLTLNVLLSFAQFEREVTGERIRDKFAASKRKGMWMGGIPPLGYDVRERRLIVNETEAVTVREIFERYLVVGSVRLLRDNLERRAVVSKVRVSRIGIKTGGRAFRAARSTNSFRIPSTSVRFAISRNAIPGSTRRLSSVSSGSRCNSTCASGRRNIVSARPKLHRVPWQESCSTRMVRHYTSPSSINQRSSLDLVSDTLSYRWSRSRGSSAILSKI